MWQLFAEVNNDVQDVEVSMKMENADKELTKSVVIVEKNIVQVMENVKWGSMQHKSRL